MKFVLVLLVICAIPAFSADTPNDPLAPWRKGVVVRPVAPGAERHTIHSYFNTCPESPDGKYILFYTSTTPEGHHGEVVIRERATGKETALAKDFAVEDAHRAACQQWVSNGKRVVFHGEREGEWFVAAVDLDTMKERVLARGQLSCWGRPDADIVPLYGPHWNPGTHRDLDLLNVATGEINTVLKMDAVQATYPEWLAKKFGDKPASIFFPILSPDLKRVYFKMAASTGGDPRSKAASDRDGIVCYSLEEKKFLYMNPHWGHPSWHPDSRSIIEAANLVFNSNNGESTKLSGLPICSGDHPSVSPDGKLRITDTTMNRLGGDAAEWGVIISDAAGKEYILLHHFDNSHGAKSWRRSHPHPVFSPDGRRIYFNVSSGTWTQLFVAEIGEGTGK